jgi:hypothetical protein
MRIKQGEIGCIALLTERTSIVEILICSTDSGLDLTNRCDDTAFNRPLRLPDRIGDGDRTRLAV